MKFSSKLFAAVLVAGLATGSVFAGPRVERFVQPVKAAAQQAWAKTGAKVTMPKFALPKFTMPKVAKPTMPAFVTSATAKVAGAASSVSTKAKAAYVSAKGSVVAFGSSVKAKAAAVKLPKMPSFKKKA